MDTNTIAGEFITSSVENNLRNFLEFIPLGALPNTIEAPREIFTYEVAEMIQIPEYTISREGDNIEISVEIPRKGSTVGGKQVKSASSLYKLPHDYTYECFSRETDVKLSVIKKLSNYDDDLTPDVIWFQEDKIIVLEFATSKMNLNKRVAKSVVQDKISKYCLPLTDRSGPLPIYLFSVLTTRNAVYSNLEGIPQYWVDELSLRLRLAIQAQDKICKMYGLVISNDKEEEEQISRLRSYFSMLPLRLSSGLVTEEDVCKYASKSYDTAKVMKDLKLLKLDALNNFNKENGQFLSSNRVECSELVDEKLKELVKLEEEVEEKTKGGREDMKRVLQSPLVSLGLGSVASNLLVEGMSYPVSSMNSVFPMAKCFSLAFNCALTKEGSWECTDAAEESLGLMDDRLRAELEETFKLSRRLYNRVSFDLDVNTQADLAKVGLNAKSFLKAMPGYDVQAYRDLKKNPFSYLVDTSDIDELVNNQELFQLSDSLPSERLQSVKELLMHSMRSAGSKEKSVRMISKIVGEYTNSYLGRSLQMISDVATELTISLRQHCKPNEWILKRVRGSNMYILIHPTRSSSHVFYGLAWPKDEELLNLNSTAIRDAHEENGWCFTDLVSVNKSKLTNMNAAHSRGLSIVGMACEHSGVAVCNFESLFGQDKENDSRVLMARRYTMVCILSMLHDKGFVDEAMSDARYVCLEGFKTRPLIPDPASRLRDMDVTLRSRMHAWVIKKLFNVAKRILSSGGYTARLISEEETLRVWSNLEDPFTGDVLESPQQLINSFYYNYLHNKDEGPEKNSSYKIPKKILEWEDKTPESMEFLGANDHDNPLDYKTMEFSPSLLRFCCDMAIKTQSSSREDFIDSLDSEIFKALSGLNYETLSTLKASASFTDTKQDRIGPRPRVMSALKKLIEESNPEGLSNPCFILDKCLEKQHSIPGLMVDTFPKSQHGGFREILVLSMPCRVIQVAIETIARTICNRFLSEIMTHPTQKLKAPGTHTYRAKNRFGTRRTITVCSSDDAKKWNQGHFVTKFMILLMFFTKPELHKFIASSLDLWLNKNIALPNDLLDMIDSLTVEQILSKPFKNDNCNKLALARKGVAETKWMKMRSSYVTTRSGMLQGILHFTSSLYHTVIQETMPSLFQELFGRQTNIVVTCMQSSDDSSFMITSPADDKMSFYLNYLKSSICFHFKYSIAKALGIYNSTKSVHSTINIMEFNSEFFDHGNLIRPTNKWVFASLTPPESGSLYNRQEHFKNLNTSILEGGGSIMLASICQMAQGMLYYRMMGSSVNPAWSKFINQIKKLRDPSLGYFMMDDPLICGLSSLKYNLYINLKTCKELSIKYKCLLDRSYLVKKMKSCNDELLRQNIMETLTTGTISSTSLIVYGDKTRWRKLIEDLNLPENWREELNIRPDVLYEKPNNVRDYTLKLALKAHSSGVMESMSQGNVVTRAIASSVYLLHRSVLTLREDFDGSMKKTSIIKRLDDWIDYSEGEPLSDPEMALLFPLHDSYDKITDIRANAVIEFTRDVGLRRRVRSDVVVYESPVDHMYSLEKIMRSIWFDHNTLSISKRIRDAKFDTFRQMMPWLNQDINKTLENSPFTDHIQLRDFLAKIEVKSRTVHLTCSPVGGRRGRSVLETVIFKNQWPGWKMTPILDSGAMKVREIRQELSQCIYQLSKSPLTNEHKRNYAQAVLSQFETVEPPSNLCKPKSPAVLLYLIQKFVKITQEMRPTKLASKRVPREIQDWVGECINLKSGVFGFYSLPQKRGEDGKYRGKGIWVGRLDDTKVEIHLNTKVDSGTSKEFNFIEAVKVDKTTVLSEMLPALKLWCTEHNCCPSQSDFEVQDGEYVVHRINANFRFEMVSSRSTPLIVKPSRLMDFAEQFWDFDTLHLELDENALRIKATGCPSLQSREPEWRVKKKKFVVADTVTILSCPMSQLDRNLSFLSQKMVETVIKNSCWSAWLARVSLDSVTAGRMICTAMNEPKSLGCRPEEIKKWLSANFWSSCSRKGHTFSRSACALSEICSGNANEIEALPEYPPELDIDLEMKFNRALECLDAITEKNVQEQEEEQNETSLGLPSDEQFEDMKELFTDTMQVSAQELTAAARHSLQEKYILDKWVEETFPSLLYGNALKVFLTKKIVQPNLENMEEILVWLSGFDEETLKRPEQIMMSRMRYNEGNLDMPNVEEESLDEDEEDGSYLHQPE